MKRSVTISAPTPLPQLQMILPPDRLREPPPVNLPDGYILRTYRPDDEAAYIDLMRGAGFAHWNAEAIAAALEKTLPDGLFLVVHEASGHLAATAQATHNPAPDHPSGGELGWVAGSAKHAGKGLGLCVCQAAIGRFLQAGYRRIYLKTDDFRLPAIKTYLKIGFRPFLHGSDMLDRWRTVCEQLAWPFDADKWTGGQGERKE